ncbi:MAG: hypothetical protein HOJ54_07300 [Phycisphaerae bacterium]|nr:hypothetical protein [Phycisphaerae bacterium]
MSRLDSPHFSAAVSRLVRRAAWRLTMRRVLDEVCFIAAFAALLGVVIAIASFVSGGLDVPWSWIGAGLAAGVLAAAIIRWSIGRCSSIRAAIVLDEKLHLHEALSTSLAYADRADDCMIEQAHRVAATYAAKSDVQRGVSRVLPIGPPERWWWPVSLAALAVVVAILPPLRSSADVPPDVHQSAMLDAKVDTDEAVAAMQQAFADAPDLQEALDEQFDLAKHVELADPTALRQETLRDLTELNRRLEAFQNGDEQRQMRRVQERLASMSPSSDATQRVRRAMSAGDLEAMAAAMEQLTTAQTDADARAAALSSLAEDLRAAANSDEALEQSLQDAGVSDEEAIDAAEHLTESQREALREHAMDAIAASETLKDMASECEDAASQCKNPGEEPSDSESACKKLAKSQRASKQASKCKNACQSSASKAGKTLAKRASKRGLGGGSSSAAGDPDVATQAERSRSVVDATTPVVATSSVSGPLTGGQVSEASTAPIQSARRRIERGLDVQRIPRRYRETVAAWFAATGEVAAAAAQDAASPEKKPTPNEAPESP